MRMVRAFILKASEGRTAPDFSLKSLAGSPGRMDLVARCAIASLKTPVGLRMDTTFAVVLEGPPDPPVTLTFDGSLMNDFPSSEVNMGQMMYKVLSGGDAPGLVRERKDFRGTVMDYLGKGFSLFYLHEQGEDSRHIRFPEKSTFILGDQKGLDPASERLMDDLGAKRVSLGPHSYLASHCITLVNCWLDGNKN
jgi:tRNA (pseudouridine54-N1)-methyltransferase